MPLLFEHQSLGESELGDLAKAYENGGQERVSRAFAMRTLIAGRHNLAAALGEAAALYDLDIASGMDAAIAAATRDARLDAVAAESAAAEADDAAADALETEGRAMIAYAGELRLAMRPLAEARRAAEDAARAQAIEDDLHVQSLIGGLL